MESVLNSIICDDVLAGLKRIPDDYVHLIVTSPPYNLRINYDGYKDNLPHAKYLDWMKQVWAECKRVLVHGGRLCINIATTTNKDEDIIDKVHALHVDFIVQLRELGYIYRGDVVWCKQNAATTRTTSAPWGSYMLPSCPHIRRNTEYVLFASKGDIKLEGDPRMSDLTKDEFHAYTLSEWRFSPETRDKRHPVPFPSELAKRCIKLFSYVGNTVLDPFVGSGTTATTAHSLGRQYIGIDQSKKYCKIAVQHLQLADQELRLKGGYKFTPSVDLISKAQSTPVNKLHVFS